MEQYAQAIGYYDCAEEPQKTDRVEPIERQRRDAERDDHHERFHHLEGYR